ncbi:MFS transporter [Actinospica robiniae]|uniref:MFS transporter n=1 Tax=Actinospica robiniae TaxID=304901 RepID=UPI00040DFB36|nr:MFS transporter [Actinospica robiniae]
MHLARYKSVLGLPGMKTFMLVALVARIPGTAWTTALTLSVVLDRHLSYAAAGAATAMFTVGLALGSPLLGRAIDRRGPRPVLLVTGVVSLLFWNLVPSLPYPALLGCAVFCGALQVPIMTLVRQSLAQRVPESVRRQAFSLDSMAVELSFMVGPAVAVLAITSLGEAVSTLRVVGFGIAAGAAVLYAYTARQDAAGGAAEAELEEAAEDAAKAHWLAPGFLLILAVCTACCVILSATDVAVVALLRGHGQIAWAGVVVIVWCAASLVGGFIHGAMPRPVPMPVLLLLLGALSVPIGLADNWWALCLLCIPGGLACAPTIASSVDAVSRAVPPSRRGQAMGMHAAALTVGSAIGAPLIGVVIDGAGPAWGMAAVGLLGCVVALAAMAVQRGRQAAAAPAPLVPASAAEAALERV